MAMTRTLITHHPAPPAAPHDAPPVPATMWIAPAYRASLARAGLMTFDAMMATHDGRLLRALPQRENWRLELPDAHEGRRGAYLKKHRERHWLDHLRRWLGIGSEASAGRTEAENIVRLQRDGIAVMKLIAFGEQRRDGGPLESFVLTEELAGYRQLDHFLRQRFARRTRAPQPRDWDLDNLLAAVADVTRRFHALGYNHRDLYCCHFFIREPAAGQFDIKLIDLQRVEHRRRLRGRWIVKDLAQLAYSVPADRVSCTQKLAFFKRYLGVGKLRDRDKRLIRRVLAKVRRLVRRHGVHP